MLKRSRIIALMALAWTGFAAVEAIAKPPDLPINEKVTCQAPQAEENQSADAGTKAEPTATAAIDTVCPCLCDVLHQCWLSLICCGSDKGAAASGGGVTVRKARTASSGEESEKAATPERPHALKGPCEYTCPYLQEKACQAKVPGAACNESASSVLENLEKLEQAQKLYRKAENYRRNEQVDEACHCYQELKALCPGSRYDHLATEKLHHLQAKKASESHPASGEAQEKQAEPEPGNESKPAPPEGEPDTSSNEVRKGAGPTGPPLVSNGLTPASERLSSGCGSLAAAAEKDPLVSRPPLAAIDPKVVDALEKVLACSGDPYLCKMVLPLDDLDESDVLKQDEDVASAWAGVASDNEVAAATNPISDSQLSSVNDDGGDDEEEASEESVLPRDWNDCLREVVDAIQGGAYAEIDQNQAGRFRILVEIDTAAISFRVGTDANGTWRCGMAALMPEKSRDLRAFQRVQNDRVIAWIESMDGREENISSDDDLEVEFDLDDDDANSQAEG